MSGYFGPELFAFLGELAAHNDRTWFAANKACYREHVEAPTKRSVEDAGIRLGELSPCYAQGSMFRIHRDTRFSKDKTPYKTNVAASFHHEAGRRRDHGVPGFYVHLAPGHCIGGGGLYHAAPEVVSRVRERIVARPSEWEAVLESGVQVAGEALKRPPAGYDPGHRFVEDLKRKDFIAMRSFAEAEVCADDFLDRYVEACRGIAPLVAFLTRALDLTW